MHEADDSKKHRISPWWIIAVIAILTVPAVRASACDGLSEEVREATERADERSETLAKLVPAETKALIQIRPDEFEEAIHQLPDDTVSLPDIDEEVLQWVDHIDTERSVVVAVATTGHETFIERAWLHGMTTKFEEMAAHLHLRLIIPTTDAATLTERMASICAEDDGQWVCRPDVREGHVTVDLLYGASKKAQQAFLDALEDDHQPSNSGLFERHTPALQAFLNTDAPVAAYWSSHHVLDVLLIDWSAQLLDGLARALNRSHISMAQALDGLLGFHGDVLPMLRSDPKTSEFADFALVADTVDTDIDDEDDTDSSPSKLGVQIDLVRTYTEQGLKVWRHDGGDGEASVTDSAMQNAAVPRWTEDDGLGLLFWLREVPTPRTHVLGWLYPVLESPGGLVKSIRNDPEAHSIFEKYFSTIEFELHPADSEAAWRAHIASGAPPESPLHRLEQHWDDGERRLEASNYPRDTYDVTRLQLVPSDASTKEPPLVAFDEDSFDAPGPVESWRGCTGPHRLAPWHARRALEAGLISHALTALKDGQDGIEDCSKEYPEHGPRFQSALGSWDGWKAVRNATIYHFHQARRHAEAGCDRGFEDACTELERLNSIDDFEMPPIGRDSNIGLTLPDEVHRVDTFLISDRGLFDGTELIVEADVFDDAPAEAVAPIVEELDGDAVQLVPDAMTEAPLVATVADAFAEHEVTTGLVAMTGGAFSDITVVESTPPPSGDWKRFGLHLTTRGVDLFTPEGALPSIKDCPPDGPTICVAPEEQPVQELFVRAQRSWAESDVEEGVETIDNALDRYRFHKIYNLIDHLVPTTVPANATLWVSIDKGVPTMMAARLLTTVAYQRQGAPFEDAKSFRQARIDTAGRNNDPVPIFESISLHDEPVSTPDAYRGMGRVPQKPQVERPDDLELNPTVEMDTPDVDGPLDREIIERIMEQNRRSIQICYETRLRNAPQLKGTLRIQWIISPGGDVVSSNVQESTLDDEDVHRCVTEQIRRWSFPQPDEGGVVKVNGPFEFSN